MENMVLYKKNKEIQNFVSMHVGVSLQENHPRCICDVCEFMAEHAYMIKRHMMRHNAEGCTCDVCGKVYKVGMRHVLCCAFDLCRKVCKVGDTCCMCDVCVCVCLGGGGVQCRDTCCTCGVCVW